MIRVSLLILVAALCGCSHMVPSAGYIHISDPNAGSPLHPDRKEVETNFLGGGVTFEFEDTDVHVWFGAKHHNATFPGGDNVSPGGVVIVSHKFRRSGYQ